MAYDRPIASHEVIDASVSQPRVVHVPQRRLGGVLRRAWQAYQRAKIARANLRALSTLTDGQLKDIGVVRSSIPYLARASAAAQLAVAGFDPAGFAPDRPADTTGNRPSRP